MAAWRFWGSFFFWETHRFPFSLFYRFLLASEFIWPAMLDVYEVIFAQEWGATLFLGG